MAHEAARLLAEACGVQPADLPARPVLGETEIWDSLAHLRLITALEQRLGRRLDPEEIVELVDLDTIAQLLARGGS